MREWKAESFSILVYMSKTRQNTDAIWMLDDGGGGGGNCDDIVGDDGFLI